MIKVKNKKNSNINLKNLIIKKYRPFDLYGLSEPLIIAKKYKKGRRLSKSHDNKKKTKNYTNNNKKNYIFILFKYFLFIVIIAISISFYINFKYVCN